MSQTICRHASTCLCHVLATSTECHLVLILCVRCVQNDIQFWRNNKSLEGLSIKKIMTDSVVRCSLHVGSLHHSQPQSEYPLCCSFIIFLYLLDNDTSWMILMSSGTHSCIRYEFYPAANDGVRVCRVRDVD